MSEVLMDPLLRGLLDEQGRVTNWPHKHARKEAVLAYLAQFFEKDRIYTEKEVNALLNQHHTFGDYFILRRGLIEAGHLSRTRNGSAYWVTKEDGSLPKDL